MIENGALINTGLIPQAPGQPGPLVVEEMDAIRR